MLPTLAFILWAYGVYALISAVSRRKSGYHRGRSRRPRYGRLALVGSVAVGLALVLWLALPQDQEDKNLKLAGFLGTVWAEGWPDKVDKPLEYPPLKAQKPGAQPVYALLHPETPPIHVKPEKAAPKPRPAKKAKVQKAAGPPAKVTKLSSQPAKKDKVAAKKASKKKKPSPAPSSHATGG